MGEGREEKNRRVFFPSVYINHTALEETGEDPGTSGDQVTVSSKQKRHERGLLRAKWFLVLQHPIRLSAMAWHFP